MVYAVYEKSPVWGARPLSANLDQVKSLPGVRDAFIIDRTVPAGQLTGLVPGVAIVAESTWAAFSARRQLKVQWEDGRFPGSSWDDFARQARELAAAAPGAPNVREARRDGDIDKAFAGGGARGRGRVLLPVHLPRRTSSPRTASPTSRGTGRRSGPRRRTPTPRASLRPRSSESIPRRSR